MPPPLKPVAYCTYVITLGVQLYCSATFGSQREVDDLADGRFAKPARNGKSGSKPGENRMSVGWVGSSTRENV